MIFQLPFVRLSLMLLVCAFTSMTLQAQSTFLDDYKIKWKNATDYTLEFAKAMPEEFYGYTPTPVEMNFREQLKHLAGNMVWLCSSYLGGSSTHVDPQQAGNSKKEIIAMLEKSFAYANQTLSKQTEF